MLSNLSITGGFKNGRSYLKDTYYTRPFRVANIGEDKTDPDLYLMIMSSSPGILDTDHQDVEVRMESGCRLLLKSQSYQRLFDMTEGASQKLRVIMAGNSAFSYIPHPVVPHENSVFRSSNKICMDDNCEFLFGEIITCGRKHSGEVFKYTRFQNLTEVFYHRKLVMKDNVLLQPAMVEFNTIGQVEEYTHQATLMYLQTYENRSLAGCIDRIYEMIKEEENVAFGISAAGVPGFVLRILGNGGEQLYNCFCNVQQYLWKSGVITENRRV